MSVVFVMVIVQVVKIVQEHQMVLPQKIVLELVQIYKHGLVTKVIME